MRIFLFFSNYLVGRKTYYSWNGFTLSFFSANIGVGQGSALSPILSALFIAPILYIFEKRIKNIKIPIILISFVDNRLFVSLEKPLEKFNFNFFYSYNVILSLLVQFGLIIEYGKIEIFLFFLIIFIQPSSFRFQQYQRFYSSSQKNMAVSRLFFNNILTFIQTKLYQL